MRIVRRACRWPDRGGARERPPRRAPGAPATLAAHLALVSVLGIPGALPAWGAGPPAAGGAAAVAASAGGAPVAVAAGVYVIVHADATEDWPQGNTIVIDGDDGVLVVDSCYLPSAARADIRQIRKLTSHPVRYLLNTHWHYDHNLGNSAYRDAFPAIEIIAQSETRRLMDANVAGYPARVLAASSQPRQTIASLKERLASGKQPSGEALGAEQRARLARDLERRENEMAELASFRYEPPTVTFDQSLTLHLGRREARIEHLLRGNTPGDAFVYLPLEKVLITGDLLVAPVPFAFNSYPSEWIRTLKMLAAMDTEIIVPGHGPVQRDKEYLLAVTTLLESVVAQMRAATSRGLRGDDAKKAIDLEELRRRFVAGDAARIELFREVFETPFLERAYLEATGSL
jgi:cyclase